MFEKIGWECGETEKTSICGLGHSGQGNCRWVSLAGVEQVGRWQRRPEAVWVTEVQKALLG